MRGFIALLTGFLILTAADPLDAKTVSMTDSGVEMQVTDLPVRRRCVVTISSGSYSLDEQACARALAAMPAESGGLPDGSYLFPGRDRRYADGSCVTAGGSPVPAEFTPNCSSLLKQMGEARVAMAVDPQNWIHPADLPRNVGGIQDMVHVSIGTSAAGRASFCVPIASSGSAILDRAVCDAVIQHAKFEPALDAAGKPVPSADARQFRVSAGH